MTTTHFHRLYAYFDKVNLSLTNHQRQLSFVCQNELSYGITYEKFIGQTGKIPTRDNLHDWFGGVHLGKFP